MFSRLVNAFVQRFGTLLLVFGAVLFALGAVMQLARMRYLASAETDMPEFAASLQVFEAPAEVVDPSTSLADPPSVPAPSDLKSASRDFEAADADAGADTDAGVEPAVPPSVEDLIATERSRVAVQKATATPVMPERIRIPRVGIDTDIVEVGWEARIVNGENAGNVWQTADDAAGLHKGSAPLGQPGNTVISGHNNIGGSVFRELHSVEKGDIVQLDAQDQTRAYVVEYKFVLWEEGASLERRKANARWIDETPDERLTLVSCYPPWGNTHRVVVVARPLSDDPSAVSAPMAR